MSESSCENRSTLNRRQMLRLSTTAGVGAALPGTAHAFQDTKAAARKAPAGMCSTPRTAGPEAAEILAISPALFRKRLQHAREAVLAFTRSHCGLVSDTASC